METPSRRTIGPIRAHGKELSLARRTRIPLARLSNLARAVRVRFVDSGSEASEVTLPLPVLKLLQVILYELGRGHSIMLILERGEMTTQQAAYALNISRRRLMKLLDDGSIPFHWVGSHRRLVAEDVLAFGKLAAEGGGGRVGTGSRSLDRAKPPGLVESIGKRLD